MGERAEKNRLYRQRVAEMEQKTAKHHRRCRAHLLKAVHIWRKQSACGDDMNLGCLDDAWFKKAERLVK